MKTGFSSIIRIAILGFLLFVPGFSSQVPAQATNSQISTESLQQEKLQLEIGELKRKNNWRTELGQSIPFLTTLVAVVGLIFSMVQNQIARKNELMLRDEEHLRSDMDQLLTLDVSKQTSIGKVSFLFDDLNQLVNRLAGRRKVVSEAIIRFIKEDCDFDNLRHIHVDIEAIQNWEDYKEHLRKTPSDQEFIFYKYIQAFRRIHEEHPSYFESIVYNSTSGFSVTNYTDELRYLRFLALIRGFSLQLREVTNAERRVRLEKQLAEALKNLVLIKQLYATDASLIK